MSCCDRYAIDLTDQNHASREGGLVMAPGYISVSRRMADGNIFAHGSARMTPMRNSPTVFDMDRWTLPYRVRAEPFHCGRVENTLVYLEGRAPIPEVHPVEVTCGSGVQGAETTRGR